jgi:hypothetical protein
MISMHLLHSIAIRPNLELKTQPKKLLGSLQLVIALPANIFKNCVQRYKIFTIIIYDNHDCTIVFYDRNHSDHYYITTITVNASLIMDSKLRS